MSSRSRVSKAKGRSSSTESASSSGSSSSSSASASSGSSSSVSASTHQSSAESEKDRSAPVNEADSLVLVKKKRLNGGEFDDEDAEVEDEHAVFKPDILRVPASVPLVMAEHAKELLAMSAWQQLALAVAAGSYIAFGAVLSVALSSGVETKGPARLLLGLGFTMGFATVILTGSVLFTEVDVVLSGLMLRHGPMHGGGKRMLLLFRFWAISGVAISQALFLLA